MNRKRASYGSAMSEWRAAAGNVLCPGKQVDADIVRGLGIFAAVERRVGKGRRAPAAPVFTR